MTEIHAAFRKVMMRCGYEYPNEVYYAVWGDEASFAIISRHFNVQVLVVQESHAKRADVSHWPFISVDGCTSSDDRKYIVLRRKSNPPHYDIYGWNPFACVDHSSQGKIV